MTMLEKRTGSKRSKDKRDWEHPNPKVRMAAVEKLDDAVQHVQSKSTARPAVGLVLGSGLGAFAQTLQPAVSLPLHWSARSLTWAHNGLTAVLGIFTLGLGMLILQQTAQALLQGAPNI